MNVKIKGMIEQYTKFLRKISGKTKIAYQNRSVTFHYYNA